MIPSAAIATAPTLQDLIHVLSLRDYTTRLVILSIAALGGVAGLIGTFLLLRRRALVGDAISHATLPGIALAFLVLAALAYEPRWLPGLLLGGALFGLLGAASINLITSVSRIKDDAALGIVLSVFFGLGVSLLSLVQQYESGSAAGLNAFITGKAASMTRDDARLIIIGAVVTAALCLALRKELMLLCFDPDFAGALGWRVRGLDLLLLALVTGVTVIGLQAVGLILVLALLIIPAAAARFWTDRLNVMLLSAALMGALASAIGAALSALYTNLPTGPIIILVVAGGFIVSLLLGRQRGIILRHLRQWRSSRRMAHQHLLRAVYELAELDEQRDRRSGERDDAQPAQAGVPIAALRPRRAWSTGQFQRLLARARRAGLLEQIASDRVALTDRGRREAARLTRNHRLWELFLIHHAEIAPSHVDRDADEIEHVLGPAMVRELESHLAQQRAVDLETPPSPHVIEQGSAS